MLRLGVKVFDRVMATNLLTEDGKPGARVIGAMGVNVRTGEFYIFRAKATMLSAAQYSRNLGIQHRTGRVGRASGRSQ